MMYQSPLVVIKIGGEIVLDTRQCQGLVHNIQSLLDANWQVVMLHGGGVQITTLQNQLGRESTKIEGRRITTAGDLQIVKQVIAGEVNVDLVATLINGGINAFGFHGASAQLISATRREPMLFPSCGKHAIDLGEVGDVVSIRSSIISTLLDEGMVPVIASLGIDPHGCILNINADTTAVKLATALSADLLLFVTAIGGVYHDINDFQSRVSVLPQSLARKLTDREVIQGGMIPKITEAFNALASTVGRVAILSAASKGAFLSIANGNINYGTTLFID